MSYTTILAVYPGEKVEDFEELNNSWGLAPVVWSVLSDRYLQMESWQHYTQRFNDLWPKWADTTIPKHHRALLMMTFDRAYITKDNFQRAATDIEAFLADFPIPQERANHWPHIAQLLKSNPDVPAIGFYHTSVSENPFQGKWDEEKEEYLPPDWSQCYDLYAHLDGVDQPA